MNFNNSQSKKVNFSVKEEIISADINQISELLHQLVKDFNVNAIYGVNNVYDIPSPADAGCIISGMELSLHLDGSYYIKVASGVMLFNDETSTYAGSLVNVPETLVPVTPPISGTDIYFLDMAYTEVVDPATETRHYYNDTTFYVNDFTANTSTLPQIVFTLTPAPSVAPAVGSVRVARIDVTSVPDRDPAPVYTLPHIWNIQDWPGTPHTFNSTEIMTLSDSLASIRAEIVSILGSGANWYDTPTATLVALRSSMTSAAAIISAIASGLIDCIKLDTVGVSTISFPAGTTTLWVRAWGPGGAAGTSSLAPAGCGGSGAYVEQIIPLASTAPVPYTVAAGSSGLPTLFGGAPHAFLITAGGGGNGTNATAGPVHGTEGAGGVGTSVGGLGTGIIINGGTNGMRYRKYPATPGYYQNATWFTAPGFSFYGCGGSWVQNAAGEGGMQGLILVAWA
jgi:hypothetical protein